MTDAELALVRLLLVQCARARRVLRGELPPLASPMCEQTERALYELTARYPRLALEAARVLSGRPATN